MILENYCRLLFTPATAEGVRPSRVLAVAMTLAATLVSTWPAAAQSSGLPLDQCYCLSFVRPLPWGAPEARTAANETWQVVQAFKRILWRHGGEIFQGSEPPVVVGQPMGAITVSYGMGRERPIRSDAAPVLAHYADPRSRPDEAKGRRLSRYLADLEMSFESLLLVPKPEERVVASGTMLKAVFGRSSMGAGTLAFGDLHSVDAGEPRSAFLYYDDIGRAQIFGYLPVDDPTRNFYLRTPSYLTALEDVGYVLLLDEEPVLAEVRLGHNGFQRLGPLPEDFRLRPNLEKLPTWKPRKATAVYQILESSKMPIGLYGWEGYLYLLAKEAMTDDGDTTWWLIKLDPRKNGREIGRYRLPTKAAHLTLVPGEEVWTALEIGPVQGIGETHAAFLETASAVLFSTASMSGPSNAEFPTHCLELSH